MITVDGTTYNIPFKGVKRRADFLDKFAERSGDGVLRRELIGVYFNYQMQFGRTADREEYNALWDKLTEPVPFHEVVVPDEGGDFTFIAYFSNVGDELLKAASNFWINLAVNFTAQSPEKTP